MQDKLLGTAQSTDQVVELMTMQSAVEQAPTEQARPAVSTGESKSYITTIHSLEERVAQSDIIVVGEIVGVGKIFNAARDLQDSTKPATDRFGVGQEYQLHVKQYYKGDGPSNLIVVQGEGTVLRSPDAPAPKF